MPVVLDVLCRAKGLRLTKEEATEQVSAQIVCCSPTSNMAVSMTVVAMSIVGQQLNTENDYCTGYGIPICKFSARAACQVWMVLPNLQSMSSPVMSPQSLLWRLFSIVAKL